MRYITILSDARELWVRGQDCLGDFPDWQILAREVTAWSNGYCDFLVQFSNGRLISLVSNEVLCEKNSKLENFVTSDFGDLLCFPEEIAWRVRSYRGVGKWIRRSWSEPIVKLITQGQSIIALTDSGKAYLWSQDSEINSRVPLRTEQLYHAGTPLAFPGQIQDLVMTSHYCLILDEEDQLHFAGHFLFNPRIKGVTTIFRPIVNRFQESILQLLSNHSKSFAQTENVVLTLDRPVAVNIDGVLKIEFAIQSTDGFFEKVDQVSVTNTHQLVLTESGQLLGRGGDYQQPLLEWSSIKTPDLDFSLGTKSFRSYGKQIPSAKSVQNRS